MRRFLCFCLLTVSTFLSIPAHGASGELELRNWENATGTTKVPVMKLRFKLSTFFQEPCERYNFYYESIDDFTHISDITLRAQVTAAGVPQDAYITAGPLVEEPGKWGWDVTGCGWWNKFFKSDSGAFIGKETAKGYFKAGIGLTNLEVVEIDTTQTADSDSDYQRFLDSVGQVFPVETFINNSQSAAASSPVDKQLPRDFRGYENNNFWRKRHIKPDDAHAGGLIGMMLSASGNCGVILEKVQWTYGGYEHVALRNTSGDHYLPEDQQQKVRIAISYRGLSGKGGKAVTRRLGTHRFSSKLGQSEGFVLVDRMRNPGGQPLSVSVQLDCEKEKEKPEDPLAEPEVPDPLEAALQEETKNRYEAEKARQDQRVAAVYEDHETAKQRREEERRKAEEWREWVQSDEYKEQQRREREAAAAAARLEKLRREKQLAEQQARDAVRRQAEQAAREQREKEKRARELAEKQAEERAWQTLEPFQENRRWGYRDRNTGAAKIYAQYDEARPFSEDRAWVRDGRYWKLIDHNKRSHITDVDEPQKDVANGLVSFRRNNDCYVYTKNGDTVLHGYDTCAHAEEGLVANRLIMAGNSGSDMVFFDLKGNRRFSVSHNGSVSPWLDGIHALQSKDIYTGGPCTYDDLNYRYRVYDYQGNYQREYTNTDRIPRICLRRN